MMNKYISELPKLLSQPKLIIVAFIVLMFVLPATSEAQNQVGVSMVPAQLSKNVDPGSVAEYELSLENLQDSEQTYYLSPVNIKGVGPDGATPVFANDGEATGFEIADWIDISVDQITIPARGTYNATYTIRVPDNASPGGHFGAVFITVEPPEFNRSGAAVGYRVAHVISLRVAGEVIEKASIRQFSTSKFIYGTQNVDFEVRIENAGNVLIRPIGPLIITNMLGNEVGNLVFNSDKAAVFPGDIRQFANIKWEGDSLGFGRYEARISPTYGEQGAIRTMSTTVSFWILPMSVIGPALGVFTTILLVVIVSVRIYIKRSLAHLNTGRRIVRTRRQQGPSTGLLLMIVTLTVTALFLIVLLALFA